MILGSLYLLCRIVTWILHDPQRLGRHHPVLHPDEQLEVDFDRRAVVDYVAGHDVDGVIAGLKLIGLEHSSSSQYNFSYCCELDVHREVADVHPGGHCDVQHGGVRAGNVLDEVQRLDSSWNGRLIKSNGGNS